MPRIEQEVMARAPIGQVWDFVKDMRNWAAQMPGYEKFEVVNNEDSVWTLNVDLGPMSRVVEIDVHVTRWVEPREVSFELAGRYEPVRGIGGYRAEEREGGTAIQLRLEVNGSGPMAKVISIMASPVLKQLAQEFATNLCRAIEAQTWIH
jgi:carbon monoxide dehydrogenase subunit G